MIFLKTCWRKKKTEKSAWLQFKAICLNWLGNVKAENYTEIAKDLLNAHQTVGCNMSLNIHYFTSQLGLVPSEPGPSKRRTRGKFPPRFFHHGGKICGKLVAELVSWLLLVTYYKVFDVSLTVHLSIFISVINQLDAQNFCFTISLFHASTCFEHMWPSSSSGGQNCIAQSLVSSHI